MRKITVIRKTGNSLRIVIPPDLLREHDLREGDVASWAPAQGGVLVKFTKIGREEEEQLEPVEAA
jgi:antitoxin component of MazEF toxin-antitoxin module